MQAPSQILSHRRYISCLFFRSHTYFIQNLRVFKGNNVIARRSAPYSTTYRQLLLNYRCLHACFSQIVARSQTRRTGTDYNHVVFQMLGQPPAVFLYYHPRNLSLYHFRFLSCSLKKSQKKTHSRKGSARHNFPFLPSWALSPQVQGSSLHHQPLSCSPNSRLVFSSPGLSKFCRPIIIPKTATIRTFS